MEVVGTKQEIEKIRALHPKQTRSYLPTMGNLHAGHADLVQKAKKKGQQTWVSIFVNPLQFDVQQDFELYPRTQAADFELLKNLDVDFLFLPEVSEIYPKAQTFFVEPTLHHRYLEDFFRPNHIKGMATVVMKFFQIIQPHFAFFGKKDYQQLRVIEQMVEDFHLPIQIFGEETVRENSGLALSSRNQFLNAAEKKEASQLYQTLQNLKQSAESLSFFSAEKIKNLEQSAIENLEKRNWKVNYIFFGGQKTLAPLKAEDKNFVILAAAYLGNTRLIDNLEGSFL